MPKVAVISLFLHFSYTSAQLSGNSAVGLPVGRPFFPILLPVMGSSFMQSIPARCRERILILSFSATYDSRERETGLNKVTPRAPSVHLASRPVSISSALCKKKDTSSGILLFCKSARRDSNPRPRPWQGRAPPTEPLAQIFLCLATCICYQRENEKSTTFSTFSPESG